MFSSSFAYEAYEKPFRSTVGSDSITQIVNIPSVGGMINPNPTMSDCDIGSFHVFGKKDGVKAAYCQVFYALQFPVNDTQLDSISLYYFDNKGKQYFRAIVYKEDLTTGIRKNIGSVSDYYDDATVQSQTIELNETVTSKYGYFLSVILNSGTQFRGAELEYTVSE